jgi:hypothetical protein
MASFSTRSGTARASFGPKSRASGHRQPPDSPAGPKAGRPQSKPPIPLRTRLGQGQRCLLPSRVGRASASESGFGFSLRRRPAAAFRRQRGRLRRALRRRRRRGGREQRSGQGEGESDVRGAAARFGHQSPCIGRDAALAMSGHPMARRRPPRRVSLRCHGGDFGGDERHLLSSACRPERPTSALPSAWRIVTSGRGLAASRRGVRRRGTLQNLPQGACEMRRASSRLGCPSGCGLISVSWALTHRELPCSGK